MADVKTMVASAPSTCSAASSALLNRAMDEARLHMRAIDVLLRARIITVAQIGKARRIARRQLGQMPPNAELTDR